MTLLGLLLRRVFGSRRDDRRCPACDAPGQVSACAGAGRALVCLSCGHVQRDPTT